MIWLNGATGFVIGRNGDFEHPPFWLHYLVLKMYFPMEFLWEKVMVNAMDGFTPTKVFALGCLVCAGTVRAAETNPYDIISQRNAFALSAALPVTNVTAGRSSDLRLTGITVVFDKKWACLEKKSREPGAPARFLTLAEGETDGNLQLLTISEHTGQVMIRENGADRVLAMGKNLPATPAPEKPSATWSTGPAGADGQAPPHLELVKASSSDEPVLPPPFSIQ
jgi:hypothetical protein